MYPKYSIQVQKYLLSKGSFNNYVDKKGGRGSAKSPLLSTREGSLDVHVDTNLKKGVAESWQMTM